MKTPVETDLQKNKGGKPAQMLNWSLFHLRNRYFVILDICLLAAIPALALTLRVNLPWDPAYPQTLLIFTLLALLVKLPVFYAFRLYKRYWRYASMDELINIALAALITTVLVTAISWGMQGLGVFGENSLPRSVPIIDGLLTLLFVGGTRFSLRAAEYLRARSSNGTLGRRVLIAGAGDAGEMVVREMRTSHRVSFEPVGFVDDNSFKQGVVIHGVRVLGNLAKIPELVEKYRVQEVIIAMPAAPGDTIHQIVRLCEQAGVPSRSVPGIFELLEGRVSISRFREVRIEDLLRREPVRVDSWKVVEMIAGKRVLVTGAGGSIGTELCLQIARSRPAQLIALGHGENSLFQLNGQLSKLPAGVNGSGNPIYRMVVADVRDRQRLDTLFTSFAPQIVFHAAAHKHVHLMEENIQDAVTNNVYGTSNLLQLSRSHGVERFVLISTDKAVEPACVMGATKRVAEQLVQAAGFETGLPYVVVRFGNVLGSRGSVVPIFQRQIEEGGPVTVTHPEAERYFMTIPEAVLLVLQAAAIGNGGEILVLDMGERVRVLDLAQDMIELSGLRLGQDIDITYTGLIPGEKLIESLFSEDEHPGPTEQDKILVLHNNKVADIERLHQEVAQLIALAREGDAEATRLKLQTMIRSSD
ncbi:MAG: polysaccharide biosynthesis protein [Chloroflexi bacterium]|nr:polysaccharide biosynthesis protein [Chloroflexota bacterium]